MSNRYLSVFQSITLTQSILPILKNWRELQVYCLIQCATVCSAQLQSKIVLPEHIQRGRNFVVLKLAEDIKLRRK